MAKASIAVMHGINPAASQAVLARMTAFNDVWNTARKVDYKSAWANGSNFDHAVIGEHAPVLKNGEVVASRTPSPNDRKLVIVGTPMGNVVVFQRYTDREDLLCYGATFQLRRNMAPLVPVVLDTCDVVYLLGAEDRMNIGQLLQNAMDTTTPCEYDLRWRHAIENFEVRMGLE